MQRNIKGATKLSEYDRNFKWVDQSLRASTEDLDVAGKRSANMYPTQEPPLQRKRRVPPPSHVVEDSDIFLLGKSTEKFAPVVPYQPKHYSLNLGESSTNKPFNEKPREAPKQPERIFLNGAGRNEEKENRDKRESKAPMKSKEQKVKKVHQKPISKPKAPKLSDNVPQPSHNNNNYNRQNPKSSSVKPKAKNEPIVVEVPLRQSEYQRNFNRSAGEIRTVPTAEGPLLTAHDLFYRSRLSAPKQIKMPMSTEYRQQFKPYRFISEEDYKRKLAILDKHHVDNTTKEVHVRPVIVTSTKTRASTPPPNFHNDGAPQPSHPSVQIDGKIYTAKNALNPQRMSFPLGAERMLRSEYQECFQDIWKDGSGREAKSANKANKEKTSRVSWQDELLDLRRRAESYRQRSRGSHFSREHLAQLIANENRWWNLPSDRSEKDAPPAGRGDHAHVCRKDDLLLEDEGHDAGSSAGEEASMPNEESTHTLVTSEISSTSSMSREPIIASVAKPKSSLVKTATKSKPTPAKTAWSNDYDVNKYRSDSQYSSDVSSLSSSANRSAGKAQMRSLNGTTITTKTTSKYVPAAGKPTLDTYPLVDRQTTVNGRNDSGEDNASIGHSYESNYNKPSQVGYVFGGARVRPSGADSASVRSNASSCGSSSTHSLAQRTLEMAKKRKTEFWKQ